MNIGSAASASGVPAKTIRYYESIGLIRPADRRGNNYRDYSGEDVQTLRFIQRARRLGFAVKDVAGLLTLWQDKRRASHRVKTMALRHIEEIDLKIEELGGMRRTLVHLAHACHGDERPDCPILDDLAGVQPPHRGRRAER